MNFSLRDSSPGAATQTAAGHPFWRVIIAEDEALPAELLKRTLIRLGHLVVASAQNGIEAITLTRQLQPDIVVMDLRMPVMDGWTAMSELTRDALAPIVVISALDDRESLEQAIFAGASAFLTKPVRDDDLERALELAVARFTDLREIRHLRKQAEEGERARAKQLRELERAVQELREAQLQLVGAARRAAVTSLAQGLAHEINNALTPIIGNGQIIALLHPASPETITRTEQIIESARRIAGWTAAFSQVTTASTREPIPFSFNGVAREVLGLYVERLQRMGITAHADLDDTLPVMHGFPDQVQEMLMMLLQNAVEALRGGGEIWLTTHYDSSRGTVTATLSDSGTGITPEQLPLVFEPGSTTKGGAAHAPRGWGLFTARQIVQTHRGEIRISSPMEHSMRGTTVRIELPLQSSPA